MIKSLRNQRVRRYDLRSSAFRWMDRNGILLRIEWLLPFHCLPEFVISFRERNGTNPSHGFELPSNTVLLVNSSDYTRYTFVSAIANSWKALARPVLVALMSRHETQESADAAEYFTGYSDNHR
jgi:hypothetical protein